MSAKHASPEARMFGLTERQWRFTQNYVMNGGNATQAYIAAYPDVEYESAKAGSARALTNGNVREAKEYLFQQMQADESIKAPERQQQIMKDLELIKVLAAQKNQFGPAVRATELQGRQLGMFVLKTEHEVKITSDVTIAAAISDGNRALYDLLTPKLNTQDVDWVDITPADDELSD